MFLLSAPRTALSNVNVRAFSYSGPMPKVSQEYRDERRAHILAAARRCFVRDGFHQTSMQDLVSEAGLSSGAVYRYFPGKNAMIEALAEQNLDEVITVLQQSLATGVSAGEAMAAVLEHVRTRHTEDDFAAVAVLVWSEALRNAALAARLRDSLDTAARALTAQAQANGPHHVPPRAVADLLLCTLPGYLMQLAIRGPRAVDRIPADVKETFSPAATSKPARRQANSSRKSAQRGGHMPRPEGRSTR